jgi:hypothetical protein
MWAIGGLVICVAPLHIIMLESSWSVYIQCSLSCSWSHIDRSLTAFVCEFCVQVIYDPMVSFVFLLFPRWLTNFFVVSYTFSINIITKFASRQIMTSGTHCMLYVCICGLMEDLNIESDKSEEDCSVWVMLLEWHVKESPSVCWRHMVWGFGPPDFAVSVSKNRHKILLNSLGFNDRDCRNEGRRK